MIVHTDTQPELGEDLLGEMAKLRGLICDAIAVAHDLTEVDPEFDNSHLMSFLIRAASSAHFAHAVLEDQAAGRVIQ